MTRQRRWYRWAGPARRLPFHAPFLMPTIAARPSHSLAHPAYLPHPIPPVLSFRRFRQRRMGQPDATWAPPPIPFQTAPAMPVHPMPMQVNRQMRRRSRIYAGQPQQIHGYYPHQAPPQFYGTLEPYYLIPATTVNSLFQQQQTRSTVPHFEEMDAAARKARNRGSRIIGSSPLGVTASISNATRRSPQNLGYSNTMPSMQRSYITSSRPRPAPQQPMISRQQQPTPVLSRSKSPPHVLSAPRTGTPKPAVTRAATAPPTARSAPLTSTRSNAGKGSIARAASHRDVQAKPATPSQAASKPSRQVNVSRVPPKKNAPSTQRQMNKAPTPDMPSRSRAVPASKTLDRVINAHKAKQAPSQPIKAPNPANLGLPASSLKEGDPVTIVRRGHLSNHLGIVHELRSNRFRAKDAKVFDWKDGGTRWYDSKRELAEAPPEERRRARPPAEGVPATAQVFDQTNLPPLSLTV